MIDQATILNRLIAAGEAAIQMRYGHDAEELALLEVAVEQADRQPAEQARIIDDTTRLYARALYLTDHALRRHDRPRAMSMCRVVAVLLPEIRDALSVAIDRRRNTRPTP